MNQEQILQKMSGEKRLEQAFQLSDFARNLAVLDIKKMLGKKASKKTIQLELLRRLHGDWAVDLVLKHGFCKM